jgi:hypothetical protein
MPPDFIRRPLELYRHEALGSEFYLPADASDYRHSNSARTGNAYLGIKRIVETIHALTTRSETVRETTGLVQKLNRTYPPHDSNSPPAF